MNDNLTTTESGPQASAGKASAAVMLEALRIGWSVVRGRKVVVGVLLFAMFSSGLLMSVSYGTVLPLLQLLTQPDAVAPEQGGFFRVLMPVLQLVPRERWLDAGVLLFAVLMILSAVTRIASLYLSTSFGMACRRDWMQSMMERLLAGRYEVFVHRKRGETLNTLINEPAWAAKCLTKMLEMLLQIISSVMLVGVMLVVNWKAALGCLGFGAAMFYLLRRAYFGYSYMLGKQRQGLWQQLTAQATESCDGLREIKAFGAEGAFAHRFGRLAKLSSRNAVHIAVLRGSFAPGIEIVAVLLTGLTVILLPRWLGRPVQAYLPILGFFVVLCSRLLAQVTKLMDHVSHVADSISALKRVHEWAGYETGVEPLDGGEPIPRVQADIAFRDVGFAYEGGEAVLRSVNLTLPHRGMVALVGPSGSGKTTLVNLLLRLYTPQRGGVFVGEAPLSQFSLRDWRRRIGLVSQEDFLFNTTLRENILLGRPDASDEDLRRAAGLAHADEFIRSLPEQYDTVVGNRGLRLSGGQRQRLAIARALLRDPDVLVFDEATSALDAISERAIRAVLREAGRGKSVLVIAHRLATARCADRIYVLQKGTVVEQGTYDELIHRDGLFARMVQAGELDESDAGPEEVAQT